MTISKVLTTNTDIEAELLLAHILKQPKEFLYLNPNHNIPKTNELAFNRLAKRRRAGEPIAYILGYKYFYGLKFRVNKNVLIPRPETEYLVERAQALIERKQLKGKREQHIKILDIGTGSGCIAISVAQKVGFNKVNLLLEVTASDISGKALEVARQNAKTHKVKVEFIQSDLFKNINGKFDIVIANLPYVPQGMYELLYNNLKYEPTVAITDGGEVWDIYQRFFKRLEKHLKPGGVVLLEMDDGAKSDMQAMIKKLLPKFKVTFKKDLGGLWRFIELESAKN